MKKQTVPLLISLTILNTMPSLAKKNDIPAKTNKKNLAECGKKNNGAKKSTQPTILAEKKNGTDKNIKKNNPTPKTFSYRVRNGIQDEDIGYSLLFQTHYPEEFVLHVNGKELKNNETIQIEGKQFKVSYNYKWITPWGTEMNGKEALFQIHEEDQNKEMVIKFMGWKKSNRLEIEGAKIVAPEKLVKPTATSIIPTKFSSGT